MGGFVGIWNRDGSPVTSDLISDMWRSIAYRGPDGVGTFVEGDFGVATGVFRLTPESLQEQQPVVGGRREVTGFDGRIDNRAAVSKRFSADRGSPDVELVAYAFKERGDAAAADLEGEFALFHFDPEAHVLFLARDPVGTKPLYFSTLGDTFLFGSEIKALLTHPAADPTPNEDMLGYHLLQGTGRDNQWDTFFRDIRTIRPGYVLRVGRDGQMSRCFWDFDPTVQLRLRSYPEYVEAFGERLRGSIERRTRSLYPVAVSVSGGVDSSSILTIALDMQRHGSGTELVPITHVGPTGSAADESRFVDAIERMWAMRIERVPLVAESVATSGVAQTSRLEMPWVNELWTTAEAFRTSAFERGAKSFMTGHWGDQVLYDQTYLVDLLNKGHLLGVWQSLTEIARWEEGAGIWPFLQRFLGQAARWDVPRSMVRPLRFLDRRLVGARRDVAWYSATIRSHGVAPPSARANVGFHETPVHSRSLYSKLRSKYYQLALEGDDKVAAASGLRVEAPFLDRDLLEFVMSIPGDMISPGGRQRAILRDAAKSVLPPLISGRRSKADFTAIANEAMKEGLAALAARNLDDLEGVKAGLVNSQALREELPRLLASLDDATVLRGDVADLLGLESWLLAFGSNAAPVR